MDRYEYNILLEKLNQFVQEEDYVAALGLVEEVDWRRVRNTRTLIMVSEVYEKNQRLEDAKDILLLAYERTTVGRSILYRLVEVAITMDSPDEALEYYMEYSLLYPNEPAKYILKYKVWQARGASYEEQIQALETYKEHEYNEKWIYELASLYAKNGQESKAVAACDEVILWFADGEYVQKAMDLKRNYTPLTAEEELKYKEAMVKKEISGDNFFDEACDPDEEEPLEGRRIEVKTGMDTLDVREDLIGEMTSFANEIQEVDVPQIDSTEDKPSSEDNLSEDLFQNIHLKGRQEEANSKAGSIALSLEEGVLETIEEAKQRQLQIEEETRKNRDALSEAMTMQDIEALVEASEARKESERIANSQPKEYEEEELEVLHKNIADGLEEFADLLKTKDVRDEPILVDRSDNTLDLSKVIQPQEEIEEDEEDENYIPGQLSFDKLLAQMNQEAETTDILKESQEDLREGISSFVEDVPVEDTTSTDQEDSLDDLDIGLGLEDFLQSVVAYSQEEDTSSTLPESDSSTSSGEILESTNPASQDKVLEIEDLALEEEPKSQDEVLQEDMPQKAQEEVAVSMEDIHFALEDFLVDLDQKEEKQEAKEEEDVFDLENVLEQEMSTSITESPIKGDMPNIDNPLKEEEELTQEQKEMLSYFAPIPGITSQVAQVLAEVRRKGYDNKTSHRGNIIVMGRQGCGKTTLATNVLKAIEKEKGNETFKVANISAKDLNELNVAEVIEKISGGGLIIEEASALNDKTIDELSLAMSLRTEGLTVILEDNKRDMKGILNSHQDFADKFTSQIVIPVFTNDELVEFAKSYADENGYEIDDMGILALYNHIGLRQREEEPVAVADVKIMVDDAIDHAQRKGLKRIGQLFGKKNNSDKKGILLEKDFEA